MAQDLLQIALEHHRAGRLQQAEAGYRNVLAGDPGNPEAMHWIGVLAHQAGRADEAIFWLEQAAAIRSQDAAFQHNLAQAYLGGGQVDEGIRAFEKSLAIDPMKADAWAGLGLGCLRRSSGDDARNAVAAFAEARNAGMDSVELRHHLGVALLASGRVDEAMASLRSAIEKDPDFVPAYHHLALALRAGGDSAAARAQLMEATRRQPSFAPAWHGLGVLEGEAGHTDDAAALFRHAITLKPNYAAAYHGLAHVLRAGGKTRESLDTFRQALAVSRFASTAASQEKRSLSSSLAELERKLGQDAVGTDLHYTLATMTNIFAPPRVPGWAVTNLFDEYAETFETQLRDQLQYRVPERLAERVWELIYPAAATDTAAPPIPQLDIFDLGCGTGLCGPLLRPLAATLSGVDLSAKMIEQARAKNVYDALEVGDLVAALQQRPRKFDLLTAADVFIYVGDLAPTFEAAAAALRPGGRLTFSVESDPSDRYHLRRHSRRYSHGKPYLLHLARICGFAVECFEDISIRLDRDQPVAGYLVSLRLA